MWWGIESLQSMHHHLSVTFIPPNTVCMQFQRHGICGETIGCSYNWVVCRLATMFKTIFTKGTGAKEERGCQLYAKVYGSVTQRGTNNLGMWVAGNLRWEEIRTRQKRIPKGHKISKIYLLNKWILVSLAWPVFKAPCNLGLLYPSNVCLIYFTYIPAKWANFIP